MTSTGTLLIRPPSTCSSPPITTGGKMPGARVLASTASASGPRRVDLQLRAIEIGGDAEVREPQVLDLRVGEEPPYELAVFAAALEREERDRHVVERIGEPRAGLVHDARRVPAEIPLRADHRAHAGAAERIDRDVQLVERAQHADVGEPAREASAEREPDRRSGEEARHARDVAGLPEPHVEVALERAAVEPTRRARWRGHVRRRARGRA